MFAVTCLRGDKRLPRILEHQEKEPQIITRFRIDRPFTAKKTFVQQGMYKPGTYECPKPHDFRQVNTNKYMCIGKCDLQMICMQAII